MWCLKRSGAKGGEEPFNFFLVLQKRDNFHLSAALGAQQRIYFIHALYERCPETGRFLLWFLHYGNLTGSGALSLGSSTAVRV